MTDNTSSSDLPVVVKLVVQLEIATAIQAPTKRDIILRDLLHLEGLRIKFLFVEHRDVSSRLWYRRRFRL